MRVVRMTRQTRSFRECRFVAETTKFFGQKINWKFSCGVLPPLPSVAAVLLADKLGDL